MRDGSTRTRFSDVTRYVAPWGTPTKHRRAGVITAVSHNARHITSKTSIDPVQATLGTPPPARASEVNPHLTAAATRHARFAALATTLDAPAHRGSRLRWIP